MLVTITTLLDYPLAPNLRGALYRAAALVPGARYDGTTYDLSHRRGVGISIGGIQLMFNPATGALIGQRLPGPGGAVTRTAVQVTSIEGSTSARPTTG
jgi:hypothetical protein